MHPADVGNAYLDAETKEKVYIIGGPGFGELEGHTLIILPKAKYKYKLKGVGPITYHLGSNYKRDPDGTFYVGAKSYIDKMIESYERTFGAKPKENSTPLVGNNHPEMDDSELLGPTEITLFQLHIGSLQWCVIIGRFDTATAVMTMSRYRAAPC